MLRGLLTELALGLTFFNPDAPVSLGLRYHAKIAD
jgi:hypothetical protein